MERKVDVIEDLDGKKTVFIHDIVFKGRQDIDWKTVELYLKQYVGKFFRIEDSNEVVYLGTDLPDEYAHSKYTRMLRGTNAKAKANAAQGIPELLEVATNRQFEENRKEKHDSDAKYGWYSYDSRFAVPVFGDDSEIERYNVFRAAILIRHAQDGKKYLYDIMKIKKKRVPFSSLKTLLSNKTRFFDDNHTLSLVPCQHNTKNKYALRQTPKRSMHCRFSFFDI